MAASCLARREPPSRAIAVLQLLTRCPAIACELRLALARLGGSEAEHIALQEYYSTRNKKWA